MDKTFTAEEVKALLPATNTASDSFYRNAVLVALGLEHDENIADVTGTSHITDETPAADQALAETLTTTEVAPETPAEEAVPAAEVPAE